MRQPLPPAGFATPSQELTYRQLTSGRLAVYVGYFDALGAARQLELRFPFFDPALVRFALLAPWEQHTRGGEIKVLLREAMRGSLPESVRRRRDKGGPNTFLDHWMRTREMERLSKLIDGGLWLAPYVQADSLQQLLQEFARGRAGWRQLWSVVSLEFWLRNHFGSRTLKPEETKTN